MNRFEKPLPALIPTLKLSLLKIWSSKLNTLNFMQAISSLFCEHSDLDRSTISSMAFFQFSFLAGCATANANRAHKTKNLMALAVNDIRLWRREEGSRCTPDSWIMNENDRNTTTDANGLGSTVFIRRPISSNRTMHVEESRSGALKPPTSVRVWIFFSFSMVFDYWGLAVDHVATTWWGRIDCASVRSRDMLHATSNRGSGPANMPIGHTFGS